MRTNRSLYAPIVARENLRLAAREAARGKRRRGAAAAFALRAEQELDRLEGDLATDSWQPGPFRTFLVAEPKRRLIAAAPFRDRVVHHAVHRVIAPLLIRRFTDDTYACLPGRGTHRAVLRFQDGLRRWPWMARLDMRRYFLEVDHGILLGVLGRTLVDARLARLHERILASGSPLYADPAVLRHLGLEGAYRPHPRKGLPIGNLTSQLFANVYLDGFDHFAKRELKVPRYVRYMDDVVLFGPTRREVRRWIGASLAWLGCERRLEARVKGGDALSTRGTSRFLGYAVSRSGRRVAGPTLRRMAARWRKAVREGASPAELERLAQGVRSAAGHLVF